MLGCDTVNLCWVVKEAKKLIGELVFDHPWLWTGVVLVCGIWLGRKRTYKQY